MEGCQLHSESSTPYNQHFSAHTNLTLVHQPFWLNTDANSHKSAIENVATSHYTGEKKLILIFTVRPNPLNFIASTVRPTTANSAKPRKFQHPWAAVQVTNYQFFSPSTLWGVIVVTILYFQKRISTTTPDQTGEPRQQASTLCGTNNATAIIHRLHCPRISFCSSPPLIVD